MSGVKFICNEKRLPANEDMKMIGYYGTLGQGNTSAPSIEEVRAQAVEDKGFSDQLNRLEEIREQFMRLYELVRNDYPRRLKAIIGDAKTKMRGDNGTLGQGNTSAPSIEEVRAPAVEDKGFSNQLKRLEEIREQFLRLYELVRNDYPRRLKAIIGDAKTKMRGDNGTLGQGNTSAPSIEEVRALAVEDEGFSDQLNMLEEIREQFLRLYELVRNDYPRRLKAIIGDAKMKMRGDNGTLGQGNTSAPSIEEVRALAVEDKGFSDQLNMLEEIREHLLRLYESVVEDVEDVKRERLMDSRMYMQATQGHVGDFIRILDSISSEKELQHSTILCQVSPRNNTCLHIAVSFGHHELAKKIVGVYPDLIKKTNSTGDTALHTAARKKNLSFVKFVMDSCPSASGESRDVEKAEHSLLRIVNKEENTVLHEALINHCRQEEVVEILIRKDPQVAYYSNKEGKSPLYLAAEAHYFHVVEAIGKSKVEERMKNRDRKAKPAVHGAILGKNKEMLEKILAMEGVPQTYEDGSTTPLHCAASVGYLEGVQKLLVQSNFDRYQRDSDGFCPIHVASMRGYVDIVKEVLQVSPDSQELLSKNEGQNFLHVAARYGKDNIVNFVLKEEGLEKLINEKDSYGNTPLHLATMHGHPKVVSSLTWDKRVDVNLVNNQGQNAFKIASVANPPTFHQRLIWMALKSAGAQPPRESKVPPSGCLELSNSPKTKAFNDRINTLLLVSTLVATVTFAAGFTVPGGYNSSDPNAGMATMLMRNMFHAFVIFDTIAMYTSILTAITLIWAQLGDLNLMVTALDWALPFLGLALTAMSLAFMAGIYLVVSSLPWLAIVVLIIGTICLVSLLVPFLLLFLPSGSTNCILRYISYYPFHILTWASKSPEIKRED